MRAITLVVILAAIGAGIAVVVSGASGDSVTRGDELPAASDIGTSAGRSWPLPLDAADAVASAGLRIGPMGTVADHLHTHLAIVVNGEPTPVPAGIGIDLDSGDMSPLHSHDSTGLVHVEAATAGDRYLLGQLFTQWDVPLSATKLGDYVTDADTSLRAYVDGQPFAGDPASIELRDHRNITLVYGPANTQPALPPAYDFAAAGL